MSVERVGSLSGAGWVVPAGEWVFTRRAVTATLVMVAVFAFTFSFTNVWALGLRLGVARWAAPLLAPAVDLSVAGLVLAVRFLSLHGGDARRLRPARLLLLFSGLATLALNAADPIVQGAFVRAAFDAVGPLLLIGWAEVGPGLLRQLHTIGPEGTGPDHHQVAQSDPPNVSESDTPQAVSAGTRPDPHVSPRKRRRAVAGGVKGELLERARHIDEEHRRKHGRPASAETLRVALGVGSARARALANALRSPAT